MGRKGSLSSYAPFISAGKVGYEQLSVTKQELVLRAGGDSVVHSGVMYAQWSDPRHACLGRGPLSPGGRLRMGLNETPQGSFESAGQE